MFGINSVDGHGVHGVTDPVQFRELLDWDEARFRDLVVWGWDGGRRYVDRVSDKNCWHPFQEALTYGLNAENGPIYIAFFFEFSERSVSWKLAIIDVSFWKAPASLILSTLLFYEQNRPCATDYGCNANIAIYAVHDAFSEDVRIKDCFDSHTI